MTLSRYLAAALDHLIHFTLAPAHMKIENRAALDRLKQIDRDILAGHYEGPDVYGTKGWTFWRWGPRERLAAANTALEKKHGTAHLPLNNAVAPVTPPGAHARDRRQPLAYEAHYTIDENLRQQELFAETERRRAAYQAERAAARHTSDDIRPSVQTAGRSHMPELSVYQAPAVQDVLNHSAIWDALPPNDKRPGWKVNQDILDGAGMVYVHGARLETIFEAALPPAND